MTESPRTGRARRAFRPGLVAVVLLAGALAFLPAAAAGSTPSVSHAFAGYNAGRVSVIVPSSHPSVELVENANSSINALLSATEVVELAPVGSSYGLVATAEPTLAGAFNGSRPSGVAAPWSLSLAADLAVRPAGGALWNGSAPTPTPTAGASFGFAELRVDFAPGASTSDGSSLLVYWNVSDWPFSSPHDLLGVVFSFAAANAPRLEACQASSSLAAPACSGSSLLPGEVRWNSGTVGVEADGASGPLAALSWTATATNGTTGPAVTGEQLDPSGGADVLVANSATSTSGSVGALAFAVYAPGPAGVPPLVVTGSGPAYLIAASIAAGGALGGVALYRVRDERIRDEL
ncbi:MAG: hypothetical protein L3K16_03765 [Thermoplasmata archaeon]|nr:hypothetical protein [Thermoplasmata archaeon]